MRNEQLKMCLPTLEEFDPWCDGCGVRHKYYRVDLIDEPEPWEICLSCYDAYSDQVGTMPREIV